MNDLNAKVEALTVENERLRAKLINLINALPDTRKLLLAREDALAELESPTTS